MKMSLKRDLMGLPRAFRRSPAVVAFLGALVVVVIICSSNDYELRDRHQLVRVTGRVGRKEHEHLMGPTNRRLPEVFDHPNMPGLGPSTNSAKSLKELVKEAVDRGLVVIVNATDSDAARLSADHPQGARSEWEINGALDGPTGDILAEVIQELRNMEEMQREVEELKAKIKKADEEGAEHCAKLWKKSFHGENALQHGDYKFRALGRPLHPLVIFSTFRFSHDEFTSVGVAVSSLLPKPANEDNVEENGCIWMDWDESSSNGFPPPSSKHPPVSYGQKRTIFAADGDHVYEAVLIKCTFPDPAGPSSHGGHLFIKSDSEYIPVLTENPDFFNQIQFELPLKHRFAFCTPPIWKNLNAKFLKQWFMYQHHLTQPEDVHYFIYHGVTFDEETMKVLQPLLDANMVTLVDLSPLTDLIGSPDRFSSDLFAQNDCLQRTRFFADWAVFWDFNEYMQFFPPHNLSSVVEENREIPFITFGSQLWTTMYCSPPVNASIGTRGEPWAIDRMIFRLELPMCGDKNRSSLCRGPEGERKYIANPRMLYAAHLYYTIDPSWGGVDIPTETARLNKYVGSPGSRGFMYPDEERCMVLKSPEEVNDTVPVDGWWWKDMSFLITSKPAHSLARESPLFSTGFVEDATAHNTMTMRSRKVGPVEHTEASR